VKKALIFGHTSGLGKALCKRLQKEGYEVIGIARREIGEPTKGLTNIVADLSDEGEIHRVIKEIKNKHSTFDVLIFCSGMLTAHEIDKLDYPAMEYMYRVNLFAPMLIESQLLDLIRSNEADEGRRLGRPHVLHLATT
jgi:short-subunit dehydrogenase